MFEVVDSDGLVGEQGHEPDHFRQCFAQVVGRFEGIAEVFESAVTFSDEAGGAGPVTLIAVAVVAVAAVVLTILPTWLVNAGGSEAGDDAISAPASATAITAEAATYLGAPYVWGGKSHSGVEMNHLADWQSRHGESVPLGQVRPGDVVGFRSPSHASFGHVGNDTFIHAPTFVVPVQYAKFSTFSRGYAEVVARRYIQDTDAAPTPGN